MLMFLFIVRGRMRQIGRRVKPGVRAGEMDPTGRARPDSDAGLEWGGFRIRGGQVPGARLLRERSWLMVTQAKVTTRRIVERALMRGGAPYLIML